MKLLFIFILIIFTGCSQKTPTEIKNEQQKINQMAIKTLKKLAKEEPESKKDMNKSIAYMILNFKTSKVPVFGLDTGYGVLINSQTKKKIYVKIKGFEIGAGWGVRSFKKVFFIYDKKLYEKLSKDGKWLVNLGAEASAGKLASGTQNKSKNKEYSHYTLLDGGGSATFTLKLVHLKLNKTLNK